MQILPYIELNGAWTFSDEFISKMWHLMEIEGTRKKVFHQGSVESAKQFIKWLKLPINHVTIILDDDNETPLLLAWLNGIDNHRAWFNFNIFRCAWGKQSIELIKAIRKYWFGMRDDQDNPIFELLLGITPANNKLALRLMRTCGAKSLEEIPNYMTNYAKDKRVGAVISYYSRSDDNG